MINIWPEKITMAGLSDSWRMYENMGAKEKAYQTCDLLFAYAQGKAEASYESTRK